MVEPLEIILTISAKKIDSSKPIVLEEDKDIINSECGNYFEVKKEVSDGKFELDKEVLKNYNNFTNYLRKYNPTLTAIQVTHILQLKKDVELSKTQAETYPASEIDEDNLPF